MKEVDLYFDVSSPWTYLAYVRLHALAARHGARIIYHPILVGAVFNAINKDIYETRTNPNPVKKRYYDRDLQNWARFAGIELIQPTVFPVRAVEALRAIIAAGEKNKLHEFATACFEAYWQKDRDISQAQILDLLAQKVGLDPIWLGERRKAPEIKEKLRSNTEELMSRGGFGSPTMYVGGQMFFGNDRMELVDAALRETVAA